MYRLTALASSVMKDPTMQVCNNGSVTNQGTATTYYVEASRFWKAKFPGDSADSPLAYLIRGVVMKFHFSLLVLPVVGLFFLNVVPTESLQSSKPTEFQHITDAANISANSSVLDHAG